MPLITAKQREHLLRNGRVSLRSPEDHVPVVRLFLPDAQATWLLTELDPTDEDRAFGLCDLGSELPELGYVSLSELAEQHGPLGLPVERDRFFDADRPLSACLAEARERHARDGSDG